MRDNDIKWSEAPLPACPYFFTAESYEKYSIADTFAEKLASGEEEVRAAAEAEKAASARRAAEKAEEERKKELILKQATQSRAAETVKPSDRSHPGNKTAEECNKGGSSDGPRGQDGRSKKLAPSRFSYLSTAEQRIYVDLYQKYSKFIPQQPNKNEVKDIQKFKELTVKVQAEQHEFQDYLERAAYHSPEVYQYIHPDASKFMQEWLQMHRSRVFKYPRYYVSQDNVSLELPKILNNPPPFLHVQTLLQLGEVPKAILPNMNAKLKPKIPLQYEKLKKRYPLSVEETSKKVCSEDENLEKLARKYGARIAMSSSSIQTLLDSQTLGKAWEIPVVVKSFTRNENGHEVTEKVVLVDKPFPGKNMTEYEKNLRFYKLAVKSFLLHPGHSKSVKLDKSDQPEVPLQRVLETTSRESCFDDVDIADLETFGTVDLSPTRSPKKLPSFPLISEMRETKKKDEEVKEEKKENEEMEEDKDVQNDQNIATREGKIAHTSSVIESPSDDVVKPEHGSTSSETKEVKCAETVTEKSKPEETEDISMQETQKCENVSLKEGQKNAEDLEISTPVSTQLRRSSRRSAPGSENPSKEGEAEDGGAVRSEEAGIKESLGKSAMEVRNDETPGSSQSVQDPANVSDTKEDTPKDQTTKSRNTRSSSRVRNTSVSSDNDSIKSEKRTPAAMRKSIRITAGSSPLARLDSGSSDSDSNKNPSAKEKKGMPSPVVSQLNVENEDAKKTGITETAVETKSERNEPPAVVSRVTRRSSKQGAVESPASKQTIVESPNPETGKTALDPKVTPASRTRRSARQRAAEIVALVTGKKLGTKKNSDDSEERKVAELASNISDPQSELSDSDEEDDEEKLVIDEPAEQASNVAESKENVSTTRRRTRSNAANYTEAKASSGATVATRRSKRLSSEPVEDLVAGNAPTTKRTRSRDSTGAVDNTCTSCPTEQKQPPPPANKDRIEEISPELSLEISPEISPESPPGIEQEKETEQESMEVDISPASPTMQDESALSPRPESALIATKVKEIPLSPTHSYPLSPKVLIVPPQLIEVKPPEESSKEKSEPIKQAADKKSSEKDIKKDESTLDSILKAQSAMLHHEKSPPYPGESSAVEALAACMSPRNLAKGADWIAAEKPSDFQSPDKHNLTYNLWQLGNIPLIIRCSLHGNIRDKKQNLSYISVCPKLEYQYPYGVEQLSSTDVCKTWISSYLRNGSSVVRARINVSTSDMVHMEKVFSHQVLPPRSAFNPAAALTVLYRIFENLMKLDEGKYLLSHGKGNAHVDIKKSVDRKGGVYDLHTAHTTYADTQLEGSPVVWLPVDPTILLPAHRYAGRVPATFDPKDLFRKWKNQPPKKKKKKNRKGKPQN